TRFSRDWSSDVCSSDLIVLRAVDPRIYSTEVRRGNVGLYSATGGGTDWDIDFDVDFITTAGTHIEFVAENAGTADAYPLIRFYEIGRASCREKGWRHQD